MDSKTIPELDPVESSVLANLKPWDLWDRPFVYETEDLDTFLLFLTDKEARQYELSNVTAYSLTLRIEGPTTPPSSTQPVSSRPTARSATHSTRPSTRTRAACRVS